MDADLLDIAATWSHWERPVSPGVERTVATPERLRPSLALVIQGVRRCGKSTLMRQLIARYNLDPRDCLFVNLEDPRLWAQRDADLLDRLARAFRAHRPGRRRTFFLDEVQAVPGWERWLRSELDRSRDDTFVVSGSNATLLSGELGSTLTGRHVTVELFPFDLHERRSRDPHCTVAQHLHDGGFPEPLDLPETEADALRRQYAADIVERDVRERVAARSSRPLQQLVHLAYESVGAELSQRRAAAAIGVATDTAGAHLDACESAYLLFQVPYFAWSERKRAHRNRKVYPVDSGLRRAVVHPATEDRGKSLEAAAYLALRKRFRDVSWWRDDRGEVDFVVRDGSRVIPVQVTWDAPQPRHEVALDAFYDTVPTAEEAWWITADTLGEVATRA